MNLVEKAFKAMFPEKKINFKAKIEYSRAFKGYNAKVKYAPDRSDFEFRLSHKWKEISEEIKIGLIQSLFNKVYDTNVKTINIELYEIFLKKLANVVPKTKTHPVLEESFKRVNEEYFNGMMIQPNLEFKGKNFNVLGTYDYETDTISISSILKKEPVLLDYVMYHELLHKKFGFKKRGKKTIHHSREFKEWEKRFKVKDIEEKLRCFIRKQKLVNTLEF